MIMGPNGSIIRDVELDPQPLGGIGFHNPPKGGVMDPTRGNGWSGRPQRPEIRPNYEPTARLTRPVGVRA